MVELIPAEITELKQLFSIINYIFYKGKKILGEHVFPDENLSFEGVSINQQKSFNQINQIIENIRHISLYQQIIENIRHISLDQLYEYEKDAILEKNYDSIIIISLGLHKDSIEILRGKTLISYQSFLSEIQNSIKYYENYLNKKVYTIEETIEFQEEAKEATFFPTNQNTELLNREAQSIKTLLTTLKEAELKLKKIQSLNEQKVCNKKIEEEEIEHIIGEYSDIKDDIVKKQIPPNSISANKLSDINNYISEIGEEVDSNLTIPINTINNVNNALKEIFNIEKLFPEDTLLNDNDRNNIGYNNKTYDFIHFKTIVDKLYDIEHKNINKSSFEELLNLTTKTISPAQPQQNKFIATLDKIVQKNDNAFQDSFSEEDIEFLLTHLKTVMLSKESK